MRRARSHARPAGDPLHREGRRPARRRTRAVARAPSHAHRSSRPPTREALRWRIGSPLKTRCAHPAAGAGHQLTEGAFQYELDADALCAAAEIEPNTLRGAMGELKKMGAVPNAYLE